MGTRFVAQRLAAVDGLPCSSIEQRLNRRNCIGDTDYPDGESVAAAGWSLSKTKDTVTVDPLTFDSAGTLGLDSTEVHGGKYSLKLSMARENPNPDVYKNWEVKAVYNFPDVLLSHLTPGLVLEVKGFAKNTHVDAGNMGQVAIFLWQPKTWKWSSR